jgi:hypothetical protein
MADASQDQHKNKDLTKIETAGTVSDMLNFEGSGRLENVSASYPGCNAPRKLRRRRHYRFEQRQTAKPQEEIKKKPAS